MGRTPANNKDKQRDHNRQQRLAAVRKLEQLIAAAVDPNFRGTISVEISAKDARLGDVKSSLVSYEKSDDS